MTEEPNIPDISEHTIAIAKILGLKPNMIRSITITGPGTVTAELYAPGVNGAKFTNNGHVVTYEINLKART